MILPIYAYGNPVLKRRTEEIDSEYPDLHDLIKNMWDTMYNADGVGLAAPQVGRSVRLFIVDTEQLEKEEPDAPGIKKVFINAQIVEENGDNWTYEEGCLSIPNVRGDVERQSYIKIEFQDENFETYIEEFSGVNARVIQHEYDHIEGILFTEKLKPIKRSMVRRKLDQLRKGKASVDYPIKFV